jgi:hypothetical protein
LGYEFKPCCKADATFEPSLPICQTEECRLRIH